jgi:hypothetical protein
MFAPTRGNIIRLSGNFFRHLQEKCMTRFAIRLLTLAMFAVASFAAPMVAPAKAATDGSTPVKKKHKKMGGAGTQAKTPAAPHSTSDDTDRRTGGY